MTARNKSKKLFFTGLIFLILAIIFSIVITKVDVQPIGPEGSAVGLATFNQKIAELIGVDFTFNLIVDRIGYLCFAVIAFYALCGLIQLIKRKSLKKVDPEILILGGFYLVTLALFFLFEKLALNFRPVLIDGVLEASYPSSHTIMILCVFYGAVVFNRFHFKKSKAADFANFAALIFCAVALTLRIMSGTHWITDIIGAVLFAESLLYFFRAALQSLKGKEHEPAQDEA